MKQREKHFLDTKYHHGTNTLKMKQLFNGENVTEFTNLAKFVKVVICQFNERDTKT